MINTLTSSIFINKSPNTIFIVLKFARTYEKYCLVNSKRFKWQTASSWSQFCQFLEKKV